VATSTLTNRILARLGQGQSTGTALSETIGVSQSSISRALRQLTDEGSVLKIGARRDSRYARRRSIESIGSAWPLRRIDRAGEIHQIGTVYALVGDRYYVDVSLGAIEAAFAYKGFTTGIPYWLQDQRPGGFLGRAVAARYPELHLPDRVLDWTGDHYLLYLTQRGSDVVSDLILGNPAFNEYLGGLRHHPSI
jgi:DNA-binding transcriptional ArsR family regulator